MTDTQNDTSTMSVTINGVEIHAEPGELLIDAAERTGTYIPRFCYHSRMKPVGMCRMCLVEVDSGRGPALQPSCMIPVSDGMTVDTESDATKKAQDGVLEFLLINHPLDCPVCDKGGECPLQDQTMAFGPGESRFVEEKRHFEKPMPISDTVYLDRERCILCDRCTRFADEVAGDTLIHFMDRGNNTQVNTFPDEPFASYFSGNTVQICPVGALTAKPYRFKARPWDLEETVSTAWTDSVGSRVTVQSSRNQVLRLLGVDSDAVNWGWLSDKERFGFEALNADARLTTPLVRAGADSELAPIGWGAAMSRVATAFAGVDPARVGVVGGSRLTNESQYAWTKLAKGVIGTDNVDAQLGDGIPAEVVLGLPRATIADACQPGGTVILVGPDPKEDLGALFLRLRHAVVNDGTTLIELTPTRTGLSGIAAHSLHPRPGEVGQLAHALASARRGTAIEAAGVSASAMADAANAISGPVTVVLGRASTAESAEAVVDAAVALNAIDGVGFLSALRRGNVHGAFEAGMAPGLLPGRRTLTDAGAVADIWGSVPATAGMDTAAMLTAAAAGSLDVLVLLGADPIADFPDSELAQRALAGVGTILAVETLPNASTAGYAHIVLPAAAPTESAGTFTNLEGRVSISAQKVTAPGTARADWQSAAEIGRRLGVDLGLASVEGIRAEMAAVSDVHAAVTEEALATDPVEGVLLSGGSISAPAASGSMAPANDAYSLRLVATRRMYDNGTMVQACPASAGLAAAVQVRLNPADFDKLGVEPGAIVKVLSGKGELMAPVAIDVGVPVGSAAIPANAPDVNANRLIDATRSVTDVRVERA